VSFNIFPLLSKSAVLKDCLKRYWRRIKRMKRSLKN